MNIKNNLTELIGNTPLMYLTNYNKSHNLKAKLAIKAEYFNPLGSIKDRAAFSMIQDAQKQGLIQSNTLIIEPTSGNTGIGLAFVCANLGYHLILTMPETMSRERRMLLSALGAEIVLTDGESGMQGAIDRANEIATQNSNTFIPQQFENPANPAIHEVTTAQEILKDTDGTLAALVATFGTGGTVSGIAKTLKAYNPKIQVFGVEPAESPVVTEGHSGMHGIQGIGANFIPKNLDVKLLDKILTVNTQDAYTVCRELGKSDGLLVGISSGAAVFAATQLAKQPEYENKLIVAICPDSGERYLSCGLYE